MNRIICIVVLCIDILNINAQKVVKIWETDTLFASPESAAYDPVRGYLYISNFKDKHVPDSYYGNGFISKVSLSGEIINLKWIDNLTKPTGICIFDDNLYIVERFGVVVYDLKNDKTEKRIRINSTKFLNDISVGYDSSVYVSESNGDIIYRIKDDKATPYFQGNEVAGTNGVLVSENHLIIGANNDSTLKIIDLSTSQIAVCAQMPKGIIDGIKTIGDDYLVSIFEGNLYRVEKNGHKTELLNTRSKGIFLADFEYIESKKILIVPTLWNNKLLAFKIEQQE